ncbi:DUF342 domain-containing protein [Campylobacter jejuni]|uniref:flagellar assembly protein A n=1 Tax=Campylobacter TaxID=194 RepID=UPI00087378C7|nr:MULTISPECIES: flagellar assembly protein A [Campylobacter]EAL7804908.1 DUF342 domain-containing protein [Campylobacter jejuni]EDF9109430.1 DUF342 domain-containing protein [Campylobacter jejuni]EDK9199112.1 DUF342 domain-containing protein [Campylobacter jejuni]EGK7546109.1 DUF342 domain-containing protein [Campylobacter jejuni]EKY8178693.1 DUF342 domain-containing protein [Campylobacter jejuni]
MGYKIKTLETFNPFESLKYEQASTDQILDFRIIDFKLLCSNIKPTKTKTYERKDFDLFYADDFFVKNYDTIVQKFLIEIYPKTQKNCFVVKLKSNPSLTYLKANINFLDNFKYYPNLKFDILQNIYKVMIKQKFLILRLNKNLFDKIDDFILSIQKNPSIKEIELEIAKGVDKIEHKSDEVIYHRDIEETCFDENTNYDEGGYCKPVQKDELLFEYIYRILGKEGRNLRGEILHLNPIAFFDNPFIIKDESIYTEELEDRIKYFSANYGFLNKGCSGYSVTNDLKLSQVGLKTTGSIKTNIDENINLEITYFDISDDAVKSGIVNVQASDIKVNGSIGATKLYGKNISIKGLTHAKSEIFAQDIFITTHKGTLQADTVYIKNLENGIVIAKNVFVENCMGGKIEAENIYICNLLADNILYPKKNLIITNDIKFKNNIVISPLDFINNKSNSETENLTNLRLKTKSKLDNIISQMQNYYDYLIKNQIKIIKIQKAEKLNTIDMKFSNLYHDIIKKYNHLSISYKKLIKLKYHIDAKLNFLDEMVYNVKIYIKSENIGEDNFLKFYPKTNTDLELKHHINLKDYEKVLYLEKGQQASYIKSSHDYSESDIEEIKIIFEKLEKDNS